MIIDPATLSLFVLTVAVFVITPGPNMIFCVSRAMLSGPAAGIYSAVGVCFGLLVHASAAGLGLSKLFQYFPLAYEALRIFGAGYLLWLAWQTLNGKAGEFVPAANAQTPARSASTFRFFVQGAINALLSPKAVFFYIVLFPQFLNPSQGDVFLQSLVLVAIINLMNFSVISVLCLISGRAVHWLRSHPGFIVWQRRCVAGVFVALAAKVFASKPSLSAS
jgi:threonine/homoserine/homoserine lactone efflux protein